ncbi:hypothetical protein HWD97_03795 [Ochrobactrum sp. C6C9]|uniref:hypothetical protein n=1 Tax=Ochrobactrum sp. C6C9 TaxID=2736662 RepID=UPI00353053F3|nr:hypothetical protein [Ochrobactrum sp. C6C9]
MKFDVLREHIGDKFYKTGDIRESDELTVKHLIRNGVLRACSDTSDNKDGIDLDSIGSGDTVQGDVGSLAFTDASAIVPGSSDDADTGARADGVAISQQDAVSAEKSEENADMNKAESSAPKNKGK